MRTPGYRAQLIKYFLGFLVVGSCLMLPSCRRPVYNDCLGDAEVLAPPPPPPPPEFPAYQGGDWLMKEIEEGTAQERTVSIPLEEVQEARYMIVIRPGTLTIADGSRDLVTGGFIFGQYQTEPLIEYRTIEGTRFVRMSSTSRDNEWSLLLNGRIPTSLQVASEGGWRDFNLDGVLLTEVYVESKAGSTMMTIPGDQPYLSDLGITQAEGSISAGFSGNFPTLADLRVDTARGDVVVDLTGYFGRLNRVNIGSLCGQVMVDLRGGWQRDCQIRITATGGDCYIKAPKGLGMTVKVPRGGGHVIAPDMKLIWSNGSYVNAAFSKTEQFLDIIVETAGGDVYIDLSCP